MKFLVSAKVTVSAHTIVEAASAADALLIAEQRDVALSGFDEEDRVFIIEEADGEPDNFSVEAKR